MRTMVMMALVACGVQEAPEMADSAETLESSDVPTGSGKSDSLGSVEPLQARYDLPDALGTPEGVAFHAPSRTFWVGSIEHGTVSRVDAEGTLTEVFDLDEDGWSTMGLNTTADRVLVCAVRFASTSDAASELWIHDLPSGRTDRVPLMGDVTNCNDVTSVDGIAYLTDREDGVVHRVDLEALYADVLIRHWELEPGLIGSNGIRYDAETHALLLGQFSPARLLRIDLPADPWDWADEVVEIEVDGDLAGWFPNGPDGMTWYGDTLVLASHDSTHLLTSDDGWKTARVDAFDNDHTIEAVVEAEGRLYGLHGNVAAYVLGFGETLPYHLVELQP